MKSEVRKKESEKKMIERNIGKLILLLAIFSSTSMRELELGPCYLSILEPCANNSIKFLLFSGENPDDSPILLDNIAPMLPTKYNETIAKQFKIIIHGYGGHIDVNGSKQIRKGKKLFSNTRDAKKLHFQVQKCVANSLILFF